MRKYSVLLLTIIGILASCGGSEESEIMEAKGGMKYGGIFRFMSSEKVKNFLPISTIDVYTQRINNQVFESLLTFENSSLKLKPNLAESYSISPDGKIYIFKIRDNVYFHDDECFDGQQKKLSANDVKFTLDLACSGLKFNEMSYLLVDVISGAHDFNAATKSKFDKKGVSGIKVKDDRTLEITLSQPSASFEKLMAHSNLSIICSEAYEHYGDKVSEHPIGTGAFIFVSANDEKVELKRNPNYWKKDDFGNQLPYLAGIEMTYSKDKKSELMAFRKGNVDMVLEIPVEEMENILGTLEEAQNGLNIKHKIEIANSLSVNYVGFACTSKEFSDERVRLAFNYALDKSELVNYNLQGEGNVATNGYVPPIPGYPSSKVKGNNLNVEKAKSLLAQAGYKDGADFGVIDFYVNGLEGSAMNRMADGIKNQLKKNLNIDINIKMCSYEEREAAIASGKAKMWRSGWIADFPDPENFLFNFYSKIDKSVTGSINPFKFEDKMFDANFKMALKESKPEKRNEHWVKCDQIVVDKSPVVPILNDDFIVIINARIKNFETNSMEILDFSRIFIKEPKVN